jgi:pimeloyl-ACP methyl ester carboxylesterase
MNLNATPATVDLICGSASLLAVHIAAHLLKNTDHQVVWLVEESLASDKAALLLGSSRFSICGPSEFQAIADNVHCHDAWVLSSTLSSAESCLETDNNLISTARSARPINLNYVCRSAGLSVLAKQDVCFCIDAAIYAESTDNSPWDDDLMHTVSALGQVIEEVQERWAEYFESSFLRLAIDPNRKLQFLSVDKVVELMFKPNASAGQVYCIGSSLSMDVEQLCSCLGRLFNVPLRATGTATPLNAIDRVLAERLRDAGSILTLTANDNTADLIHVEQAETDPSLIETMLQRAYERHTARDDERREQVAALVQNLLIKKVSIGSEGQLSYYCGGTDGDGLILLSALGQGIECWVKLIERLRHRHRIYLWEPRGVMTPASRPIGLDDHVEDIEAVIRAEGLSSCVLVGWCNGPQVAVDFYRRHPELVRAMVFLNCTFEVPGRPDLDAPYEKYFRKLCEVITTRPQFAHSAMKTLGSVPEPKRNDLLALDEYKRADTIVRLPPRPLRPYLVRPFETVETTRRYAAQVLDYFAHNSLEHAAEIDIPLLVLSAEYDSVVSPERVEAIAGCFPRSSYSSIPGATHYALYEQPERVAISIESFLSELDRMSRQKS